MSSQLMRLARPAFLLCSLALAGASTSAQTSIGGTIFDGSGGPLLAGQVYHATTSLTIPVGQTLTVQPGAIIKFVSTGSRITVNGTFDAQGNPANKIRITGIEDDSAGGDTNGNGPSSATPGSWQGVILNPGSVATFAHVDLAYYGASSWAGITDSSASLSISDSVLRDGFAEALEFNSSANSVSVTDTAFLDNGAIAVDGATIAVVEGFLDNEASGNGGNYINVTSPSTSAILSVGPENTLNNVLVFATSSTIASGGSLTIRAGLTVKMLSSGSRITANGTFRLAGAPGNPAVVTSFDDDDHAGDTNNDGASSGSPGSWQTVIVNSTGTFEATDAILRYAGASLWATVHAGSGTLTMLRTTVRDAFEDGLDLNSGTTFPSIRNCDFIDNGGGAVTNVRLDMIEGFKRNRASGNAAGNYVRFSVPSPTGDVHVKRHNLIDDLMVFQTSSTIPSGVTVTMDAGVIVKWTNSGSRLTVNGTLELLGAPCDPTVLTAFSDDTHGGDTNLDGPSVGAPGSWQTILVNSTGSLRASYAEILWAGSSSWAVVQASTSALDLNDCLISGGFADGLDLGFVPSASKIVRCRFENNGQAAVNNAHIESVPGFLDCSASGNGNGDFLRVTSASPVGDVTIEAENTLGAPLVLTTSSTIPSGQTLTLGSGVTVKWASSGSRLTVNGTLRTLGSGMRPVVLTSLADDAIGGDTNGDGPSTGTPGGWQTILVNSTGTVNLEHTLIRYPGSSLWSGLLISNPGANPASSTLRSVRVEHALSHGIRTHELASDPANVVAFDCGGIGIDITGGSFDLRHATSVGNGADGIQVAAGFTGNVVNSIAWGNTPNYTGLAGGAMLFSNGSAAHAGSNGNINAAPSFVDSSAAVGDLRLQAGSACVDVADSVVAQAVMTDFDENSRLLDPNLTGVLRADMGAYERARWEMKAFGEPRIGTDLRFRVDGPTGVSSYWLGLLDGTSFIAPFGFTTAGSTLIPLGTRNVGQMLRLQVPDQPALAGLDFGIQTLTTPVADPTVGAMTNLYRATVLQPRTQPLFKPLR